MTCTLSIKSEKLHCTRITLMFFFSYHIQTNKTIILLNVIHSPSILHIFLQIGNCLRSNGAAKCICNWNQSYGMQVADKHSVFFKYQFTSFINWLTFGLGANLLGFWYIGLITLKLSKYQSKHRSENLDNLRFLAANKQQVCLPWHWCIRTHKGLLAKLNPFF